MGVSQLFDAMLKMKRQPKGFDDPRYTPPKGHDVHLSDHQRAALPPPFEMAHRRKMKIRHGQDAIGHIPHVEGQ